MTQIVPTITTDDAMLYEKQMRLYSQFARRIHIDIADGEFAPTKLTPIRQVWWARQLKADVHVMYRRPFGHVDTFIEMNPSLVIVHVEAEGNFRLFAEKLKSHNIKVGLALLPETKAELILPLLDILDHVLIFGGHLGFQGSKAKLKNLKKVAVLKNAKPDLEISWDGGVDNAVAGKIIKAGVDVLNVGGFIAKAVNPYAAYATLETIAKVTDHKHSKR